METNFKVDVPSFALGYSAGRKKGGSGGGAELNIHYSLDTPPEDTSKLWAKCNEAKKALLAHDHNKVIGSGDSFFWGVYTTYTNSYSYARAIGNLVYFCGTTKTVRCYNLTTKTYTTFMTSDISFGELKGRTVEACGDKIYFFGGSVANTLQSLDEVWVLNTTEKTFVKLDVTLPVACTSMNTAVIGKKIYLFGGQKKEPDSDYEALDTIMVFDTETNKVDLLDTKIPTPLFSMAACVVYKSDVYLVGGKYDSNVIAFSRKVYRFNPESETINAVNKDLPYGLNMCGGAIIGEWVLLIGGVYCPPGANMSSNRLEITALNLRTMEMAKVSSLSFSFNGAYVHVYDNYAYVIGGSKSTSNNNIYGWYPYHYPVPKDEIALFLSSSNTFPLINASGLLLDVGVTKAYRGDDNNEGEQVELALYKNGAWTTI